MFSTLHVDLDGAWSRDAATGAEYLDARQWGPRLRFSAPRAEMERFYEEVRPRLAPFTLYGSGEFHHLSALWLRQFRDPVVLVSFDNHPDWDVRPPHCPGGVRGPKFFGLPSSFVTVCVGQSNEGPFWR